MFWKVLDRDHGPVYRYSTDDKDNDLDLDLKTCFEVATYAVKHIFKRLDVNSGINTLVMSSLGFITHICL